MFKFFFKKNSWDIWDNLFHCILINLITLAVGAGCIFLFYWLMSFSPSTGVKNLITFGVILLISIIMSIFVLAEGENAAKIADFQSPFYSLYFKNLLKSIKDGILTGLFVTILIFVATVTLPEYYRRFISQGNFIWLFLAAVVFWFLVITFLSFQYFLAIRSLMGNRFFKCLKKCYILFFDNPGFTLSLALVNLLNLVITVITFGLAPGISGITITCTNALRLRLYKYDWYEVNPDLTPKERKHVPWDALLEKDKKTFGPRKFRNIFKPWNN